MEVLVLERLESMKICLSFLLLGVLVTSPAVAQLQLFKVVDKTVAVQIPHPPTIGLTVKRVAFGPPSGPCADELVNSHVMSDFQLHKIEVVDREHLSQILAEQNFSQTQQQELALGRILGPTVMIFVRVDECSPDQQHLIGQTERTWNGQQVTPYISKTRFALRGSLEAVNLTTGQALQNGTFQATPEKQNENTAGYPEYVPADEVKATAMDVAASQIHQLFFPWTESVRLFVHDDNDCGLKQVSELIHGGDRAGAFQLSQSNLNQCKSSHKNEKTLARAYYDAGVAAMMSGKYDQAKPLLTQAMTMKGANEAAQALEVCNRAQAGALAVQHYETAFALIPAPSAIAALPPPQAPTNQTAQPQSPGNAPATASNSGSQPSVEARLRKLDQLLKQGLITRKEYDAKKAQILSDL